MKWLTCSLGGLALLCSLSAQEKPRERPGKLSPRESTGLVPLTDMKAEDRYQGREGGLYGQGKNVPPEAHGTAAAREVARIVPLDAEGKPESEGRIVLISISMSNATQEFSVFKKLADADPGKSPRATIVDCAQGGQAMAQWAPPDARAWREAERRLAVAGVTPQQVQVAWIKLANVGPSGDLAQHTRKLKADTQAVLQNARKRFPNLRLVHLGSRIYGGYSAGRLNPEPYAYEGAFAVRDLIAGQIAGEPGLAHVDGKVPLLLWGPYLWADGTRPRRADRLVWERQDFAGDGTHPSMSGREKVARLLLEFYRTDPTARSWFMAKR